MTTLSFQHELDEHHPCECGECDWVGPAAELETIADAEERIYPGEPVPAGQCPECGALAHVKPTRSGPPRAKVTLVPGAGFVASDSGGCIGHEAFTVAECADLADMLESLNAPNNGGSAIRRLTDLLWALQNDTDAMILTSEPSEG